MTEQKLVYMGTLMEPQNPWEVTVVPEEVAGRMMEEYKARGTLTTYSRGGRVATVLRPTAVSQFEPSDMHVFNYQQQHQQHDPELTADIVPSEEEEHETKVGGESEHVEAEDESRG